MEVRWGGERRGCVRWGEVRGGGLGRDRGRGRGRRGRSENYWSALGSQLDLWVRACAAASQLWCFREESLECVREEGDGGFMAEGGWWREREGRDEGDKEGNRLTAWPWNLGCGGRGL